MTEPALLKLSEVCALLQLSERKVRGLVADGRLPVVEVDGARRYDRADVDALIASSKTSTPRPASFRESVEGKGEVA